MRSIDKEKRERKKKILSNAFQHIRHKTWIQLHAARNRTYVLHVPSCGPEPPHQEKVYKLSALLVPNRSADGSRFVDGTMCRRCPSSRKRTCMHVLTRNVSLFVPSLPSHPLLTFSSWWLYVVQRARTRQREREREKERLVGIVERQSCCIDREGSSTPACHPRFHTRGSIRTRVG